MKSQRGSRKRQDGLRPSPEEIQHLEVKQRQTSSQRRSQRAKEKIRRMWRSGTQKKRVQRDEARLDWEVFIGLSKMEATGNFAGTFAVDTLLAVG